jgi:hypothetical protein
MAQGQEVKSLLLQVDASVELLRRNLTDAERSLDSFTRKGDQSAARFDRAMKQTVVSTGQLRAGAQQLSFQIADVATSLASGARPLQVFAQQSTQVVQAIGLMTNNTKGFIGFIGGPWGIALTAGITLLASFSGRLFEGAEASKQATVGASALADAQGVLGQVFDVTSGKIKTQNELLLANARLTAANLRADALAKRTGALSLADSARRQIGNSGATTLAIRGIEAITGRNLRPDSGVGKLIRDVESGALNAEQALRFADTFDLNGAGVDRNRLRQAIVDIASAREAESVAGLIDKSLRDGRAAPGLITGTRSTRTRRARTPKAATDQFGDFLESLRIGSGGFLDSVNPLETSGATAKASAAFYRSVGTDPAAEFQKITDRIDAARDEQFQRRADDLAKLYDREANQIQTLAGIYQRAFQGGTKAIWQDFKQLGLAVVAQVLARFTASQLNGGGFNLGSAFSAAFTSVLGFANGGNPPVGKASLVGERGPELFVPSVPGRIIPNGQIGGGNPVSVTINAPGATAETVSMIRREILNAAPVIIGAAQKTTVNSLQRPRLG